MWPLARNDMDTSEADPYEQQLLAVFESFDSNHVGSLDSSGLQLLFEQLPLDSEQAAQLLKALLPRPSMRVTFPQFRDGLLALLGGGLGSPVAHNSPGKSKDLQHSLMREESPEREVSPKLVLGQKKYGRRSRPESSEHDSDVPLESDADAINPDVDVHQRCLTMLQQADDTIPVDQDEDSHNPKKRRTAEQKAFQDALSTPPKSKSTSSVSPGSLRQAEDCLKLVWQQYGDHGYVNQTQLGMVCERIGIEKLSQEALQQLFEQLDGDSDGKVSLDEFLHLFRSGGNWSPSTPVSQASSGVGQWTPSALTPSGAGITDTHSGGPSLSLIECNGVGMASADSIVEMWESSGVSNPSQILRDLNMDDVPRPLNVSSLASLLEEEIRQAKSENPTGGTPVLSIGTDVNNLVLAALALRQAELRWLRFSMEQMVCERDKLRNDLAEANHRANLLAQEIDDHHSKLEKYSQNQVKQLEQKHAEAIRELTARLSFEREQLIHQNNNLEQKALIFQQTESKLSAEVTSLRVENENLDQETRSLTEQIAECEKVKRQMEKELQEMVILQQRLNEIQASQEQDQVQPLLERLGELQAENSSLRDRNDELTVELEVLTGRLANLRVKRHGSGNVADSGVGGGTKRRGKSPHVIQPQDEQSKEESPRVGKVRRCSQRGDTSLDTVHLEGLQIHPLGNSESGVEADLDFDETENLSSGSFDKLCSGKVASSEHWLNFPSETSSVVGSHDDLMNLTVSSSGDRDREHLSVVARLQARVEELERALQLHPSNLVGSERRTDDLEGLREVEDGANHMHDEDTPTSSLDGVCMEWGGEGGEGAVAKIAATQTSVNESEEEHPVAVQQLQKHCRDLESQLDTVKIEIVKILSEKRACNQENCILKQRISDLRNQLPDAGAQQDTNVKEQNATCPRDTTDSGIAPALDVTAIIKESSRFANDEVNLKSSHTITEAESQLEMEWRNKLKALEESHASTIAEITDRCGDLEKSLAMLRDEYERCEDYWAGKLDEERHLAEQEQRITDEKFSELMSKIREYEDLFADDRTRRSNIINDGRLETIEEQDGLEKQVMELEEELEDIRNEAELRLQEKEGEINALREQLQSIQSGHGSLSGCGTDVAVQVSDLDTGSWGSDRTFIIKPRIALDSNKNESGPSKSFMNGAASDNVPSTPSTSSSDSHHQRSDQDTRDRQSGAVRHHQYQSRHRRMRHHPHYVALNCLSPQNELHAAGIRLRDQEQACIRLQRALHAQQQQAQALLQHTWERHKHEVADLQLVLQCTQERLEQQGAVHREQMNRLSQSDILVKELYVENAHLLARIQGLEQQCHLLLQRHASITNGENCSSV